jgi:hypothetical protein
MASKIVLPDAVRKVGSFGELQAPGSKLTGQARLLTGQPAQRAGKESVPARPALPQLLPEQKHVMYTRYGTVPNTYLLCICFEVSPIRFLFLGEKNASVFSFQSTCQASFHFTISESSWRQKSQALFAHSNAGSALINFHLI